MLLHYAAVAVARLRAAPFAAAAKTLTLALGLGCFLAAWGVVSWLRSADGYRPEADRIVVIGQSVSAPGENPARRFNPASSHTIAKYLREDEPGIERLARALPSAGTAVAAGERKAALDAVYVEPDFLAIFGFEFVEGSPAGALSRPGEIVLTRSAAERLFGAEPALGRSLRIDDSWDGAVVGVVAPIRKPSFLGEAGEGRLGVDVMASWSSNPGAAALEEQDVWNRSNGFTFALLPQSLGVEAMNARLAAMLDRRAPAESRQNADIRWSAYPIGEMRTRSLDAALFAQSGVDLPATAAILGLGLLTLVVAGVNYANLAIAQAAARLRETGLRKVLGASRLQLLAQAWTEALLLAAAAMAIALAALALLGPAVRAWTGVEILSFLGGGLREASLVAGLAVLAALAAGAYPAIALSGERPARALEAGRSRSGPRGVMRALVGVQFASASFLLILVAVAGLQRSHLEGVALDAHEDVLVVLNNVARLPVDQDVLADRLSRIPGVVAVSYSDREPWSGSRLVMGLARSAEAGSIAPSAYIKVVRPGYFEAVELDVLAGRVFDPERETGPGVFLTEDPSDERLAVIDRAMAERLGFAAPEAAVGRTLWVPDSSTPGTVPALPVTILGVVETEVSRLEASDVMGHFYVYTPWRGGSGQFPLVRIDRDRVGEAVPAVEAAWDELAPDAPVQIRFFDEMFEASFATHARAAQLFMLLAGSAFVIASIGQLGVAVHVAARRRHEIAVRKTLGSSTLGIVRLLLVDFAKPALVANLAAWPLGWLAGQTYLSAFADRVALTPAPFAGSLAVTLAIAWAAVIGEALKAARVRPAEVLRQA